jgi:hypothetical protein
MPDEEHLSHYVRDLRAELQRTRERFAFVVSARNLTIEQLEQSRAFASDLLKRLRESEALGDRWYKQLAQVKHENAALLEQIERGAGTSHGCGDPTCQVCYKSL